MPQLFKTMILVILALILAGLAFVVLQPSAFAVSRKVMIVAPVEKVFPRINTLRNWQEWSPWAKLDPEQQVAFEGPESGVGAIMRWQGNSQVGRGAMAIIDSKPISDVRLRLDFVQPYETTSFAAFKLEPVDGGTEVTWTMNGERGLIEKIVWMTAGVQTDIEKRFDAGLQNLKRVVQSAP